MKKFLFLAVLAAGVLSVSAAFAADWAVLDVQKITAESAPGKAAAAHIQAVQKVLQKGMDDVIAMYKGKENTPEARQAIADAQNLLNRQLQIEQQAALNVVQKEITDAVKAWRKKNPRTLMVINKQLLIDSAPSVEITNTIMKQLRSSKPKFPDLPKVTIGQPKTAPKPAK
ncbi:MAG: OmpH family outer membrane protein [Pyramidobacter sp.]|nr:OmpH family outer membrane protein [Pyramidobacter sp.]